MTSRASRALLTLTVLLLAACGKPAGSPCSITGDGFTARHNCATKCLSRWTVNCPDGSKLTPNVCAGRQDCTPGSCPENQACYSFDDPFEKQSYCVPDTVCGAPMTPAARARWEQDSSDAAAATRAAWAAKFPKRNGGITAPAEPVEPPNPQPETPAP